jgi:hypothetical protein
MLHNVRDLSPDQRNAIESLLGRQLADDEALNIQLSRILHEAPVGEERSRAWAGYLSHLDVLAERVQQVPDDELESIIDEACGHARHSSE